ncbi:MAG TPA: class I SAM-dependent methyltransferase [Woeseiaceae bacterium]|nr:class I SAM-dependent methyltransferase [Woeseiaceae bacterium]
MSFIDEDIESYSFAHTRAEPPDLQALAEKTTREMPNPGMLTGRVEGRLLKLIAALVQPRFVLEVGTFTGYSALSLAEGAPEDAKIVTCEIDPAAREVAQAAFDASPFGHKIEIRMGPALETIAGLEREIDLAFIDADKERYPDYYEAILARTRPGGVLVLDNMLWSGKVLRPRDATSRTLHALNEAIAGDPRVENVLLTVRDGVQLVRKL